MLNALVVGHNSVMLQWTPGFDGGVRDTKYVIAYRPVASSSENDVDSDCFAPRADTRVDIWNEFDCRYSNPCNVSSLEQYQAYVFKVRREAFEEASKCDGRILTLDCYFDR